MNNCRTKTTQFQWSANMGMSLVKLSDNYAKNDEFWFQNKMDLKIDNRNFCLQHKPLGDKSDEV